MPVAGALIVIVTLALAGGSSFAARDQAAARAALLRRAQVWQETDIGSKNLLFGPPGAQAFAPLERVTCEYRDKKYSGASPKFACELPSGERVKVKYGGNNGEVYGEVLASRLLWALGFPADRMYPVRVVCSGCPDSLRSAGLPLRGGRILFDPATIEREMPGREITSPFEGWTWDELGQVDAAAGGAPLAHRDALKLLAAFMQHTDSKADNQVLLCADASRECEEPVLMIGDLGLTFGRASFFNSNDVSAVNLAGWSAVAVWKDPDRCIANLAGSYSGTLADPAISEAGRRFLAGLLSRLSDAQVRDAFVAARVVLRPRLPAVGRSGFPSVSEWVRQFDRKRFAIVNHTCPAGVAGLETDS
jgi:hypothetical protein